MELMNLGWKRKRINMANEIPIEFRKDDELMHRYSSITNAIIGSSICRTTIIRMLRKGIIIRGYSANCVEEETK
jgi:hypothetical protein